MPSTSRKAAGAKRQTVQVRQSARRFVTQAAQEAAKETVKATFLTFGVDLTNPDSVTRLQRIFEFGSDMLDVRTTVRRSILGAFITLVMTGIGTLVVLGLRNYFRPLSIGATVALSALMATASPARAHWKAEYAAVSPAVQEWFGNAELTASARERLGFRSCCKSSEVVHTKFKVNRVNGADEWYWLDGETWKRVPPDIIHWGETGPNGDAILFVLDKETLGVPAGTPTCFWPPQGGL